MEHFFNLNTLFFELQALDQLSQQIPFLSSNKRVSLGKCDIKKINLFTAASFTLDNL